MHSSTILSLGEKKVSRGVKRSGWYNTDSATAKFMPTYLNKPGGDIHVATGHKCSQYDELDETKWKCDFARIGGDEFYILLP
jgi:hypothetical protein